MFEVGPDCLGSLFSHVVVPVMNDYKEFFVLAEHSQDMLCIVDGEGRFRYVNPAWTRVLGWMPDELIGSEYLAFVHEDDLHDTREIARQQTEGRDIAGFINRYRTKDGSFRNVQWWSQPTDGGNVYASAHDITEIQRSSSRAAEIEDVSGVCSWEFDVDTGAVYWSPGTQRLIGWKEQRHPTLKEALELITEEGQATLKPVFENLIATGTPYAIEMPHYRIGGGNFLAKATGAAEVRNGKVLRVYGTFEDITERRSAKIQTLQRERSLREAAEKAHDAEKQAALKQAWTAKHDPLTGIGNRQLLDEVLNDIDDEDYLVVAIDLDRFKDVNDSFGHEAGDCVLFSTAKRLRTMAGPAENRIFRIGGDEFVMMLPKQLVTISPQAFCDWIVDQLVETIDYKGVSLLVGASVGFSEANANLSARSALRQADMALYEAKSQGRNRATAWTATIGAAHADKIELANDLKSAVPKGQIGIVLQPQVSAISRELIGCEVLARWHHPTRGTIPPNIFIPLADELNLLGEIDRSVLDSALKARAELANKGLELPKVAVNVSAKRLMSSNLPEEIAKRPDVPKDGLAFEILETAFLDEIDTKLMSQIEALRAQGIRIEVDDFGTGHASIASVLALRPHVLKFDRLFVPGIDKDAGKREMMAGLLKVARNIGAETLVEGVETHEEARVFTGLGVDYLQGFAIGRPMTTDSLLKWAQQQQGGCAA